MPAKKKTAAKQPSKSFEETLLDTANTALRASAQPEFEGTPQSVPEGQDNLRGSVEDKKEDRFAFPFTNNLSNSLAA